MIFPELSYMAEKSSPDERSIAAWRFQEARLKARKNQISLLLGFKHALKHLKSAGHQRYIGQQLVALSQITGSENRTNDFDSDFNPLKETIKDRWVSVMAARMHDIALPPVELLKVGDEYYVRDGHHRISVAHALSETGIEAVVRSVE